jgi:peptidase E
MPDRQILATSGGWQQDDRHQLHFNGLIRYALRLSGQDRPRLCFVNTASGDSHDWLALNYAAAQGEDVDAFHLELFSMPNVDDIGSHLCSMDVIWVNGGSVANLLALWRLHGVDEAMREAWENGTVLAGVSAGSICWHSAGTTDSFGPELGPVTDGLGFLPYGNGVHYDGEQRRRPLVHKLVADGTLPLTYCTDDGTGLHYIGTELVEAVSEIEGKTAWKVERDAAGSAVETAIPTRLLD